MPINKYFGGHGSEVMSDMQSKHGSKKGKQIFYATANKRGQNPETHTSHGSLEDITALEQDTKGATKLKLQGFLYEPGQCGHEASEKHFEELSEWETREIKNLPDYNVDVVFHGPDTEYRAEEIDMQQYGTGYEPIPLRDFYKSEDHIQERSFRSVHQDLYDETETPGVVDKGDKGRFNHQSFDDQRDFSRAITKKKDWYAVEVEGIDTKKGSKIR